MDFSKLIARVKDILFRPKTEWPIIATEQTDTGTLYKNYIIWLAAIPAIFGFIKGSLIGYSAFTAHFRTGIAAGIVRMLLTYVLTLMLVYVVALIINALANTFNAQKNMQQALKTAAYAYTAAWLANIGQVVPSLGVLILIAGAVYSTYLLYLGLPHTMKCPQEKAAGYTAVTLVIAMALWWILALVIGAIYGHNNGISASFDKDSRLGQLEALSERMQAVSDKMDKTQKSADTNTASQALGSMMAAVSGSDHPIQALSPDQLKSFLPGKINGLPRTSISAERNQAMGMQVSQASAEYMNQDNNHAGRKHVRIELADTAGVKGLLAMNDMFGDESEKQDAHGYERNWRENGRMIHEKWNNQHKTGEYSIVVGNRFTVEASGNGDSIDDLKRAATSIDLAGLEKLKDSGVQ